MPAIVVAVDFSESSRRAMEAAAGLAKDLGARLVLVHAFPPLPHIPDVASSTEADPLRQVVAETHAQEAVELSSRWAEELRAEGLTVETVARDGRAWEVVQAEADRTQAAMIVVGSHGHTGLKRVLLGSTAQDLVRHASCPVLVVPAPKD